MQQPLKVVLGLSLLLSATASAGPLYGTVRMGPGPAAGIAITVACPDFERPAQVAPTAVTDTRGSFSMLVPATGRCQMRAGRGNEVGAPFSVFVSNNPLRFDFEIDGVLNRMGR